MRVAVVGAGVIGLASACFIAEAGHDVVVLERDRLGEGASAHNAGWIVPSMATPVAAPGMLGQALRWLTRRDSPLYIEPGLDPRYLSFLVATLLATRPRRFSDGVAALTRLARGAIAAYDRLSTAGVPIEQREGPLTMLFTDPGKFSSHLEELREMDRSGAGLRWEQHDRDAVRAMLPGASPEVVGAITTHGDRILDPVRLVDELAAACRRRGVEIVTGSAVGFALDRGAPVLRHGDGMVRADAYVVAAGVWTGELLRPLGDRIRLGAGKGYGFDVPPVAELSAGPLYLAEGRVALTPLPDRLRLSGTMGFGRPDLRIDRRRANGILSSVERYLGGLGIARTAREPWAGLRPMTPDGVPIIGRLRSQPSVIVATGHQMLGVTLGPATGLAVADLIETGAPDAGEPFRVR